MSTETDKITVPERQLMNRLRAHYPTQTHTLSDEQLLGQVQNAIAAGETIKITEVDDIFRFMSLPSTEERVLSQLLLPQSPSINLKTHLVI